MKLVDESADNEEVLDILCGILRMYKTEAYARNWRWFGLKATTMHAEILDLFLKEWPRVKVLTTFRHPASKIKSLGDAAKDRILETWKDKQYSFIMRQEVTPIHFQSSWENGFIKGLVAWLGMQWSNRADSLYDRSRTTLEDSVSEEDISKFADDHPVVASMYNDAITKYNIIRKTII